MLAILKQHPDKKIYADRVAQLDADLADKRNILHHASDPVAEIRDADRWLKQLLRELEQDERKFKEARAAKLKAHEDWEAAGDRVRKRAEKVAAARTRLAEAGQRNAAPQVPPSADGRAVPEHVLGF